MPKEPVNFIHEKFDELDGLYKIYVLIIICILFDEAINDDCPRYMMAIILAIILWMIITRIMYYCGVKQ